eukprot:883842-Lingulodinium_polyedra.AAC.1
MFPTGSGQSLQRGCERVAHSRVAVCSPFATFLAARERASGTGQKSARGPHGGLDRPRQVPNVSPTGSGQSLQRGCER